MVTVRKKKLEENPTKATIVPSIQHRQHRQFVLRFLKVRTGKKKKTVSHGGGSRDSQEVQLNTPGTSFVAGYEKALPS